MRIERTKVTPALAREWLEKVPTFQRNVSAAQVNKLAKALAADLWRENGATIVFNRKDELIDGQHRLHAIVKANRSVWLIAVVGVDSTEETFTTIDDSKARNISDFFHTKNRYQVSAIARYFWGYSNEINMARRDIKPPIADVVKLSSPFLAEMEDCDRHISHAYRIVGQPSWCGFLYFYYRYILKVDVDRLDQFFIDLGDGLNLSAGSPVAAIRNRFLQMRTTERIPTAVAQAMILKALNYYLEGATKIDRVTWNPYKEPFPPFFGKPKGNQPFLVAKRGVFKVQRDEGLGPDARRRHKVNGQAIIPETQHEGDPMSL